jgi:hypothetical protein
MASAPPVRNPTPLSPKRQSESVPSGSEDEALDLDERPVEEHRRFQHSATLLHSSSNHVNKPVATRCPPETRVASLKTTTEPKGGKRPVAVQTAAGPRTSPIASKIDLEDSGSPAFLRR